MTLHSTVIRSVLGAWDLRPTAGERMRIMRLRLGAAVALVVVLASGCLSQAEEPTVVPFPTDPVEVVPSYDEAAGLEPGVGALALIPAAATTVTITDFDEIRAQLGVPELTSEDPIGDSNAFWERAHSDTVMLAEGLLRDQNSRFLLDYEFTQDDVDWEAHFIGPDGLAGWVLSLRPDLDMARVERAVKDGIGPLKGAEVDAANHLVTMAAADEGDEVWGGQAGVLALVSDVPAESSYLRTGCIPLADVLGPDAGFEDQEEVLSDFDITQLDDAGTFGVSFVDGLATARLGEGHSDLFDRADLAESFPTIGSIGFGDGFADSVVDPSTGRIGFDVINPVAAVNLTLTDELPFAVCNEVPPPN